MFQGKGMVFSTHHMVVRSLAKLFEDCLSTFQFLGISFPVLLSSRGCYPESEIHAFASLQKVINDIAKTSPILLQNVNNFSNLLNFTQISLYLAVSKSRNKWASFPSLSKT